MSKELTIRQAAFVAAYCGGMNATKAAIEAGYSPSTARTRGYELLQENANVKRAVEAHRAKLRTMTGLNAETAMEKFETAYGLAVAQKNMTAAVRALELQAKLAGLLNDKDKSQGGNGFQINIIGVGNPKPQPLDVSPAPIVLTSGTPAGWTGPQVQEKESPAKKNPPDIFG